MPTFKKSKQKHGLYSEEKLKMAVADVIENGFSLRKAASICNVFVKRTRPNAVDRLG